jgi:hypothetical protein
LGCELIIVDRPLSVKFIRPLRSISFIRINVSRTL